MSDTRLILHVKGTEAQTTELPRRIVRAAISCGQITHSQLIWSPIHNAWKQVREMPELLPSQKLAPAPHAPRSTEPLQPDQPNNPVARAAVAADAPMPKPRTGAVPKIMAAGGSGPVPKIAGSGPVPKIAGSGPVPKVKVGTQPVAVPSKVVSVTTGTASKSAQSAKIEEGHDFHPFKWICIGLGGFLLLVLGLNIIFVDHPLNSKLSGTPYAKVSAYAHLGAFFQPNVLVIHVPASTQLNSDNLSAFFSALAQSTPRNPVTANLYDRVAITSGWTAQYSFSGEKWKELGEMSSQEDDEQRRDFILAQIADPGGTPLVRSSGTQDAIEESRTNVWNSLVTQFTKAQ